MSAGGGAMRPKRLDTSCLFAVGRAGRPGRRSGSRECNWKRWRLLLIKMSNNSASKAWGFCARHSAAALVHVLARNSALKKTSAGLPAPSAARRSARRLGGGVDARAARARAPPTHSSSARCVCACSFHSRDPCHAIASACGRARPRRFIFLLAPFACPAAFPRAGLVLAHRASVIGGWSRASARALVGAAAASVAAPRGSRGELAGGTRTRHFPPQLGATSLHFAGLHVLSRAPS